MRAEPTEGLPDVAARLADLLADAPGERPRLVPLAPMDAPRVAAAVDASSVRLAESGSLVLAAHRAAAVAAAQGRALAPRVRPAEVVLLDARDASGLVSERLARAGAPPVPPGPMPADAALAALRTLREHLLALDVVETLDAGDALLLDGALHARPPVLLLDRLLARARERGVDVVGVCKTTSLTLGRAPAIAACLLAARDFPARTWAAEVVPPAGVRGRTFLARLSPAEPRAFRFDVQAAAGEPLGVLARLAGLAGHPGYPGYPSPLAMAHHATVLTEDDRRRLLQDVEDAAVARGVPPDAWRAAFQDYHEVLELGV